MVNRNKFQGFIKGKKTDLFMLENSRGMKISITNYGGRIVSWMAPDRHGHPDDIVLGFESLEEYITAGSSSYGATIGRFANRIANGRFRLDGQLYQLETNNPPNHLHGGPGGLYHVVFDAHQISSRHLSLQYLSPDGEEGYPGNMLIQVLFTLNDAGELSINYTAVTDKPTIINLTNHAFFNLHGSSLGLIDDHQLMINASNYTPVDETSIPVGEIAPVEGTPFDFREMTPIGKRQSDDHQQLKFGRGYDHNFVIDRELPGMLTLAARVFESDTGRILEVETTEPGIQLYGGNSLNGSDIGKKGMAIRHRNGFCLETQHYPDSPNQPAFPSTRLDPGEFFHSVTIYRMLTD
jgi:aldose 1-epimerase